MMECKKALVENNGDIEVAIEAMRKSGQAKAAKKAGRVASQGMIVIQQAGKRAAMVEVNCETDFVSKGDDFKEFCTNICTSVLATNPSDLPTLLATPIAGASNIEEACHNLVAKIGENIQVRRFALLEIVQGHLGIYLHGSHIGVLVEMLGGTPELAKDIAMHIAASRPLCVSADQVSPDLIAKEREIYRAQAEQTNKPANIIEKMVNGRIQKFLAEVTLLGQPFVKDLEQSVEKLLKTHQAEVTRFERFEVGEGIEKKSECFTDEVMKQVQGTSH
jgi:elongation factor Ts